MSKKRPNGARALRASLALTLALGMAPSFAFADDPESEAAEPDAELQAAAELESGQEATEPEAEAAADPEIASDPEPEEATEAATEAEDAEYEESEDAEEAAEQKCGDDLEWSVDDYGTLTITGTGAMWDFSDESPAPWADQADRITSLVIEEGATSIGANAFNCLYALESVQLPESVGEVPDESFDGTPYQAAIDEAAAAEAEQQAAEETEAADEAGAVEPETEEAAEPEAEKAVGTEVEADEAAGDPEPEPAAENEADQKAEPAAKASGKDSASADDDDLELTAQAATSGWCGANAKWSYSSGTLTISGTGKMGDYLPGNQPWADLSVKKVVISSGITYIGSSAFHHCTSITSVSIPSSVTSIGMAAFFNTASLKTITIPNSVTTIGGQAFVGVMDAAPKTIKFGRYSSLSSVGNLAFDYLPSSGQHHVYAYKGTTAYRTLTNAGVKVIDSGVRIANSAIALSYSKATYSGAAKRPTVSVTLNGRKLVAGTDYSVAYSNNVKVGTATVKVTGKGKYTGTKSATFKINPKGTSVSSLAPGSACMTVKWSKQATQTSGYQVRYSRYSDMSSSNSRTVTVSGTSTVSKKLTGLYKGKRYYVQVRTYKTVNGVKYYSAWSAKKYATTK